MSLMTQSWRNVFFAHWPVASAGLERLIPPPLELELRDGSAWLTLTTLQVESVRPFGFLPTPFVAPFAQANVRTYVRYRGRPAVFFLSIEASGSVAALAARLAFGLPVTPALIRLEPGLRSEFRSESGLRCAYRSAGRPRVARAGTLDHWLLERYSLLTVVGRDVLLCEIDHPPWQAAPAQAEVALGSAGLSGFWVPRTPKLAHLSQGVDAGISRPAAIGRR